MLLLELIRTNNTIAAAIIKIMHCDTFSYSELNFVILVEIGGINSNLGVNNVVFSVHLPHPGAQFNPIQQFLVVSMNAEVDVEKNIGVNQVQQRNCRIIFSSYYCLLI